MVDLSHVQLEPSPSTVMEKNLSAVGVDPAKATDPRTVDNFRTDCLRELVKIKTAWPGLQYRTGTGVLVVSPSLPCIQPRHQLPD